MGGCHFNMVEDIVGVGYKCTWACLMEIDFCLAFVVIRRKKESFELLGLAKALMP